VAADSYADVLLKNGIKPRMVQTVTFYVEDEFFQQPIKLSAKGTFSFCYVGGFHPYHILLPVIEAFESLSKKNDNIELRLVGEGPLLRNLQNEVSKRKLTHKIKFVGRLPHAAIPNFLSEVDSVIIPTTYGISANLLEAAAAGKAIITIKRTSDAALEFYFRHRKEIYMADSISPDKIAKAMTLLYEDSNLRNIIAHGARQVAQQHFTEEIARTQLEKLILRIS
jgi:glycosyltransferase involved in cell wall biosynthesis